MDLLLLDTRQSGGAERKGHVRLLELHVRQGHAIVRHAVFRIHLVEVGGGAAAEGGEGGRLVGDDRIGTQTVHRGHACDANGAGMAFGRENDR